MQINFALLLAAALMIPSSHAQSVSVVDSSTATATSQAQLATTQPITLVQPTVQAFTSAASQVARVSTTVDTNGSTRVITIYQDATNPSTSSLSTQPSFFSSQANIIAVSAAAAALVVLIVLILLCFRRSRKRRDISYRPSEHKSKSVTPPLPALPLDHQPQIQYQDMYINPDTNPFIMQEYQPSSFHQPTQQTYYNHSQQQFFYGEDGVLYQNEIAYHDEGQYEEAAPQSRAHTRG